MIEVVPAGLALLDRLVDLDWKPGCEWAGLRSDGVYVSEPGCGREAEWIGTALCCGKVWFYCQEHKAARQAFVNARPSVRHRTCGALGAPMRFDPLSGGSDD